jgi:hypothetical protein
MTPSQVPVCSKLAAITRGLSPTHSLHDTRWPVAKWRSSTSLSRIDSGASATLMGQMQAREHDLLDMLQPPTCSFRTSSGDRDVPLGVLPRFPICIGNLDLTLNIHVVRASNYDILLGSDFFHQSGATLNYVDRTLTYRVDRDHSASIPIAFDTSTSVMYAEGTPLPFRIVPDTEAPPIVSDTEENDDMPPLLSDSDDENYGSDVDKAPPPLVGKDSDDDYDSDNDEGCPPLIYADAELDDEEDDGEDPPPLVHDDSDSEYDSDYEDEAELLDAAAADFVEATLHNGRAEYFRSNPAPPTPAPERLQTCGEWKATISALVNLDDIMEQIRTIRCGVDLTDSQQDALLQLLHEFEGSFQFKGRKFGFTDLVKHHIRTGMAAPIKQHAYRLSQREKRVIEQAISEMLLDDIIEPGHGPWASPPLITGKKDGGDRFCVDLRKVNAVTDKNSYPIPRIDDLLDEIGQASWFSSIDLKSG